MPGFIVRDITCIDSLTLRLCPMKWILVFCFVRKLRNKGVEKWCRDSLGTPAPELGHVPACCPVCGWRGTCPSLMEEQAAQSSHQAVRSDCSQCLRTVEFHGWVIGPTPVMSSCCVTLSRRVSPFGPWGILSDGPGLAELQRSSWGVGGGGALGQGREKVPCLSTVFW